MPDWQERITHETEPAIRAEHDLRYRVAADLIRSSSTWCDLGCGNGLAAADALGEGFAGRAVLVDVDPAVIETAAAHISSGETVQLAADLASPEELARVREALLGAEAGERTVTCFEVIEHLTSFAPLVSLLVELAADHGVTVVLSVPNDAFWALENPHHHTVWGEGAFEELRRLLPADHVLLRQLALNGSRIVRPDAPPPPTEIAVDVPPDAVPTNLVAAFGPRAGAVAGAAMVVHTDLDEQRAWERQRESDIAFYQHAAAELEEMRAWAREQIARFDEWRAYIHELEAKLGLPLSGGDEQRPALPVGADGGPESAGSGSGS